MTVHGVTITFKRFYVIEKIEAPTNIYIYYRSNCLYQLSNCWVPIVFRFEQRKCYDTHSFYSLSILR